MAHGHGVPLMVDNTVASPMLLRPIEYGADIVVHSLTKFMGGHGTTLGGAIVDSGNFRWNAARRALSMFSQPDASYHGLVYTEHFGARRVHRALPQRLSAHQRRRAVAAQRISVAAGNRDSRRCASSATLRMAARVAEFLRADPARRVGQVCRISRQPVSRAGAEVSWPAAPAR